MADNPTLPTPRKPQEGALVAAAPNTALDDVVKVQKQTRESAVARVGEEKVKDAAWTAQMGGVPENAEPVIGQIFTAAQLPNTDVQKAANIDPEQANALLVVLGEDEALRHESGPEYSEAGRLGLDPSVVQRAAEPRPVELKK